jgi:hypothetical protein
MNLKLKSALLKLDSAWKIQTYISTIPYNPDDYCRSAERVFLEKKAHCMEGALLAALALERLGHEPALLHFRSHRDDDHVVTLFQEKGLWGAVGKSNTTLLGWRSPVYETVRELAMSYFPFYFNLKGQMSLISWAGPVKLSNYEKKWDWREGVGDVSDMGSSFYREKAQKIMSAKAIEKIPKASKLLTKACFLGADASGLYKA